MTEASTSGVVVRKKTAIWLIGVEEDKLLGSKLPSNKQVLRCFFYHHKTMKQTVRDSARTVVREAAVFWNKASIPMRPKQHAVAQLELLHRNWTLLQRNASRKSDTQRKNEGEFVDKLEDLFDIAHMNALEMITLQEDKYFLLAQREKGRRGSMGSVDKVFAAKELKRAKRARSHLQYEQRNEQEQQRINELINLESSTYEEASLDEKSTSQNDAIKA